MKSFLTALRGHRFSFLYRMRLWQKFALLGLVAVALTSFPMYRLFKEVQDSIETVRTEESGLEAITTTLELVQALQDHRASGSYFVLGDEKRGAVQPKNAAEVDAALLRVGGFIERTKDSAVVARLATLKQSWAVTKENVTGRRFGQREIAEEHITLINDSLGLVEDLMSVYKIDLDSDPTTYYMARATLIDLPRLSEALGQLRSPVVSRLQQLGAVRSSNDPKVNTEAALRDAFRPSDRARIAETVKDVRQALEHYVDGQAKAIRALPELQQTLAPQVAEIQRATTAAIELVQREILSKELPTIDAAAYLKDVSIPRESVQKAATQQKVLTAQFQRRVAEARSERLSAIVVVVALFFFGIMIAAFTVNNITSTVALLQESVEKVRGGDTSALQLIESRDEVGDLGRTVNLLLQERIAAQAKSEEATKMAEIENEKLNNSVISILGTVSQLSQRDLTVRAPVTDDIIGTVSDSINALTDETTRVLRDVAQIAGNVADASGKVKGQANLVSRTAEDERKNVGVMIDSLAQATEAMNQVAVLAEQSNLSAERATQATDSALETVNGTVNGMEAIRETISETEKRIKRLGERSQEITGIVNLINTISERTHVLALNASMQAAVAGEAGRGFAVVAEEVQRLAESSRNATQQIGTLVGNIQLETNETIATVNRTIGQVVLGSEQAQKAGESMRLTKEITGELVGQVRRIAASSISQKTKSEELLNSVKSIGESTERTAQQIESQNIETDTLLQSARQLVASVNVFKLASST